MGTIKCIPAFFKSPIILKKDYLVKKPISACTNELDAFWGIQRTLIEKLSQQKIRDGIAAIRQ